MLAWTLTRHGSPEKSFELREHRDPLPKEEEVLIECQGFGLNFADVMAVKGLYRDAPPLPSILGYEVVGRVVSGGSRVPADLIGKRVVAFTKFGGYAQKAVTDHRAVVPITEDVSIGEAAALATQGATAWYAARILCPLQPLERVLIHSAAGGVGHLLVQLAIDQGCEVFAIANGEKKMEFLRSMGVQHVFDRGSKGHLDEIRKRLSGKKIDASFNAVGGSTFKQDMGLIGSGGRIVLFGGSERGGIGTFGTLRFVLRMGITIPIFLMMTSRSILGVNMYKISQRKPELVSICLHRCVEAFNTRVLRPHVHAEFDHNQLPEAHKMLASGATIGKVVVKW
ncbi:MAG: zinc-binding dehydrogenase [Bacteroidota bacterium]|nr:zinc-binding dehydrogenase [Bacteroidota bacterium]